ncbi:MAG TPA: POTRA domain-containing protein [Armatimonadota bacterium]|nr:POTRA domain-containing protein [Armatimonadota bacterium]
MLRGWLIRVALLISAAQILWPGPALAVQAEQAPAVQSVRFVGRMNVEEEAIRGAVTLKPGEAFSAAKLESDRKALLALGYFRRVDASEQTTDGRSEITFRLVEWPRVAHIRVVGNSVVDRQSILAAISTRVGEVLRAPRLQADVQAVEQLYRERGYVAHISEKLVDEASRSGILRFEILEVSVAEVLIENADAPLRRRARRVLAELPPVLYRPEAVSRDQRRLLRVEGVRSAMPRVEAVTSGTVRIRWLLNTPESAPGEGSAPVAPSASRQP